MSSKKSRTRRPRFSIANLLLLMLGVALAAGWWSSVDRASKRLDLVNSEHQKQVREWQERYSELEMRLDDGREIRDFYQQYHREKAPFLREVHQRAGTQDRVRIRNYDVQFTDTPPTIDGVVDDVWDNADPPSNYWRILRHPFAEIDQDFNRFRMLYDDEHLYVLYEVNKDGFYDRWLDNLGGLRPDILFAEECLWLYLDPNKDGDLNNDVAGKPLSPGRALKRTGPKSETACDGYHIAFNQYEGTSVSADSNQQGVGVFTEAHVNSPFGDQGNWNQGEPAVSGAALSGTGIVIAQVNRDTPGAATGKAEIKIPFADLDVDAQIPDPKDPTKMIETGLNASEGVSPGEVWGFNIAQIPRHNPLGVDDSGPYLPVWQWHDGGMFAMWPHGTITFQAPRSTAEADKQSETASE